MEKRLDVVLHSDYPPEACFARLADEVDIDDWTVFSLSGYKGSGPILGRLAGNEFRLHKRRPYHNSFGPLLLGRVMAEGTGSRIEGYVSVWPSARLFIRIWFAVVALIGVPAFLVSIQRAISDEFSGDWWVGLVVPPGMLLWGLLVRWLGAAIGAPEKDYLREFLEQALLARPIPGSPRERNWTSTFDRM